MDKRCLLLDNVLTQLQYIDGVKWGAFGNDNLYPGLLTSRDELMKKCTLKDLKIICKTLEHHTNRCWFETGAVKSMHVNRIIRAFGGTHFVQETALRKKRQTYNPTTLKVAARNILLNDNYKLENLQILLGTVLARECKHDWYEWCTINLKSLIPFADGKEDNEAGEYVELFSYPEKKENNDLCYKTFDYTHILTNMRSHILTRGYEFCKKEDFEWIVYNMTGVLSCYLVEYNMDSQNAFSAMKLFSNKVVLTLESNGRTESVKFVKLVKAWHMACDERGIPADV